MNDAWQAEFDMAMALCDHPVRVEECGLCLDRTVVVSGLLVERIDAILTTLPSAD